MLTLPDLIGLSGTACVVGAYLATQAGWLRADQIAFPLINLTGAILLSISLYFNFNLASAVIEAFWIGISLFGIARILARR
ncbi:CBU_0592 family membrane protein [Paracoccus jiaweipingae]|uniref:CBU_0592 family membrane protein n=1 Tax=unclassified Paracoccus (in: a-proteobacteria) TaxID=2688777 RepID=UPI0037AF4455